MVVVDITTVTQPFSSALTTTAADATMPELPSDTCRITGTVIGIDGTYFTLDLRDGSKVLVEIREARREGRCRRPGGGQSCRSDGPIRGQRSLACDTGSACHAVRGVLGTR